MKEVGSVSVDSSGCWISSVSEWLQMENLWCGVERRSISGHIYQCFHDLFPTQNGSKQAWTFPWKLRETTLSVCTLVGGLVWQNIHSFRAVSLYI